MGEVSFPEAGFEALTFVLDRVVDLVMPTLQDHLKGIRQKIQVICDREKVTFRNFEDKAIHIVVIPDWRERLRVLFPDSPHWDLERLGAHLRHTGIWMVQFLDKRTRVDFFDVLRDFRAEWNRMAQGIKNPLSGKYMMPGAQFMGEWKDRYMRETVLPAYYCIFRNAKFDEERVVSVIRGIVKGWELKNIFDA